MAGGYDSAFALGLAELFGGVLAVISLAVLILWRRDRIARSQGKTPEQVPARFDAIVQFHSAAQRCIPGALILALGIFYAVDRVSQHDSDWWMGLLFIPVGWILIPLLARKSWHRYLELQRIANKGTGEYEHISTEPPWRT
jgi:hypothetical protein